MCIPTLTTCLLLARSFLPRGPITASCQVDLTRRMWSTARLAATPAGTTSRGITTTSTRTITTTPPAQSNQSQDSEASFQPHPADVQSIAPTGEKQGWTSSRPYEDWVVIHPVYSPEEVNAVKVVHHPRITTGDKLAAGLVWFARRMFDVVTGYKHASPEAARKALAKAGKENASVQDLIKEGYIMSVDQWMARILFLESIAGVPGMVAGTLRHLRSLRLMKRDGGWINTLLQEAENERMHLMVSGLDSERLIIILSKLKYVRGRSNLQTFMKIKNPGLFFRACIIGAQGVFYNAFFLAYIISPRSAHRFVGCLEEQACLTYTQIIDEIERGHIPEWDAKRNPETATKVPGIALDYWRLPSEETTMLDLIKQVRADEAGHRFTNHTLANLDYTSDHNPLGFRHASAKMQGEVPGLSREESIRWSESVEKEMRQKIDAQAKN
ncbi:BQ5605_C030g10851 [Microbotryum silenes-dioicae]|uniref:Alternative oxidase n=1 Tax=Microbotryum silenes-dioicae TaxID=796604 RepID=A0A2X0N478_9BASI|nr:BQ5605_C030g10851 [Microbotryum silenes-dioicae]